MEGEVEQGDSTHYALVEESKTHSMLTIPISAQRGILRPMKVETQAFNKKSLIFLHLVKENSQSKLNIDSTPLKASTIGGELGGVYEAGGGSDGHGPVPAQAGVGLEYDTWLELYATPGTDCMVAVLDGQEVDVVVVIDWSSDDGAVGAGGDSVLPTPGDESVPPLLLLPLPPGGVGPVEPWQAVQTVRVAVSGLGPQTVHVVTVTVKPDGIVAGRSPPGVGFSEHVSVMV
ncbi:MAG: hypothetical protein M1816_003020 [Peltula sp. TS41687]|nr:MAG: hypothetical protein M1816_003020 [Peltula sp. TS41687]